RTTESNVARSNIWIRLPKGLSLGRSSSPPRAERSRHLMTSHTPEPQVPLASALPTAAQRLPWLERMSRYRQPIGLAVTLLLFAMALIACRHLLSELDIYALHDAMLDVPAKSLIGALLATVAGFVILLGYEWSASRYAAVKLPARTLV